MIKKIFFAFVLLCLFLLLFINFRKDLSVSKATVKANYSLPNSHFLIWEGGEIHYTESGSGPTVLMIHGFGGSNRDFYILDSLINKNYRVIRVDLPGFGLSDFPKQTVINPDYTKVYDQYFNFLLDTLHIDSCYAMGNSLGGLMAWNLAIKHPTVVKKLVLFNSAGYDMPEVMKTANANIFRNQLVQQIVKKGIPTFAIKSGISRVFFKPILLTEEKIKRVSDFWNREGNLQHIVNMANANTYLDEKLIQQIACPTLIVWGKQDQIVSVKYAEHFHKDIKGSQVIVYDSCGHVPMLERPLDTERDILKFLQ